MDRIQVSRISKTAISRLLNDKSEFVIDNRIRLVKALSYVCRVYYGLNLENQKYDDVIEMTVNTIIQKYNGVTFEMLNVAYSEIEIEKKEYVSLTVRELIGPIEVMTKRMSVIQQEIEKTKQKETEIQKAEIEKQRFKSESEQMYLDHFNNGLAEWTGSDFQANQFAMCFKEQFSQERKNELWINAQREFKERNALFNDGAIELPPPPERFIFSRMIVNEALSNRKMLILE